MKKKIALITPLALSIVAASVFTFSGCGNGWFDSKERRETPSALMFDAQKAYDNEEYSTAASLYAKAVKKDPNNVQARIGWAFAVNGEGGMSLTQVMHDIIASEQESSSTTNLADSSSSNGFAILSTLGVDFSDPANKDFIDKLNTYWGAAAAKKEACSVTNQDACEIKIIKEHSKKMSKLIKSFQIVCPLMDPEVLAFIEEDSTAKRVLLGGKTYKQACGGGLKGGSGAAAFAAVVSLLGQAAVEWTILDHKTYSSTEKKFTKETTGDGQPDLIGELTSTFSEITKAKDAMSSGAALSDALTAFSTQTSNLNNGIARTELDSFKMMIKNVKVITKLVETSLKLGDSTTKKFEEVESKIDEATAKISQYSGKVASTSGTSTGTTSNPTESATKAATAANNVEEAIAKKITDGGTISAAEKQKLDTVCSNFSVLKVQAGLPDNSYPPCNCDSVKTPTDNRDACCASKSTASSSDRQNCCKSAYDTINPPSLCLTTAKSLVSNPLNLIDSTKNAPELDLTASNSGSSRNEQLLTLLELFQVADRTWREER